MMDNVLRNKIGSDSDELETFWKEEVGKNSKTVIRR